MKKKTNREMIIDQQSITDALDSTIETIRNDLYSLKREVGNWGTTESVAITAFVLASVSLLLHVVL